MKLAPTIRAIIETTSLYDIDFHPDRFARRIAHEACRLQRAADYAEWNERGFEDRDEPFHRPLVVLSTESS
jgi:hypothetical protein